MAARFSNSTHWSRLLSWFLLLCFSLGSEAGSLKSLDPPPAGTGGTLKIREGENFVVRWDSTWPATTLLLLQGNLHRTIPGAENLGNETTSWQWHARTIGNQPKSAPLRFRLVNAVNGSCDGCEAASHNFTLTSSAAEIRRKDLKLGMGIGLGLGVPLLVVATGLATCLCMRRRKRKNIRSARSSQELEACRQSPRDEPMRSIEFHSAEPKLDVYRQSPVEKDDQVIVELSSEVGVQEAPDQQPARIELEGDAVRKPIATSKMARDSLPDEVS